MLMWDAAAGVRCLTREVVVPHRIIRSRMQLPSGEEVAVVVAYMEGDMRTRSNRRQWVEHPRPRPRVDVRVRSASTGPVPSHIAKGYELSSAHFFGHASPKRASSEPPVTQLPQEPAVTSSGSMTFELEWKLMLN